MYLLWKATFGYDPWLTMEILIDSKLKIFAEKALFLYWNLCFVYCVAKFLCFT